MLAELSAEIGPGAPRAWVSDFDDTEGVTISEQSPNGLDVDRAYRIVLADSFGQEALDRYISYGGHRNRTPAQIVHHSVPDLADNEVSEAAQILRVSKIGLLIAEVGTRLPDGGRWPRPTPGFLDFSQLVQNARDRQDPIATGIITAGHEEFITRFLDLHGISPPDVLISDDELQVKYPSLSPTERSKPTPFPMDIFKSHWLQMLGVDADVGSSEALEFFADRIIYTGDDPVKDGGLAENTGVVFHQIQPAGPVEQWRPVAQFLGLVPDQGVR